VLSVEIRKDSGPGAGDKDTGDELVFKISPHNNDANIQREYQVLSFFDTTTTMPVPQPYLIDSSEEYIPGTVLVMSRLPGSVMHQVFGLLSGTQREAILEQITDDVITLHHNRSTGFGGVELPESQRYQNWPDFWLPRFDDVMEEAGQAEHMEPSFLRDVAAVRKHVPDLLAIGNKSCLTHYDIWAGNVMIAGTREGYTVSGYLDVPGYWADYARELSFMEMFGLADEHFYRRYFAVHPYDDGFELRKNVYNLKMHMKHMLMYPGQSYYIQGAHMCLQYIQDHM
jgi:fructosamine-3-kinase